ncbi:hypothetical protein EV361DRAFT_934173 [Lentinula raphanica]|nr:hypothetical protein EV361DRAFT_934173 [Lentinula raphanica]
MPKFAEVNATHLDFPCTTMTDEDNTPIAEWASDDSAFKTKSCDSCEALRQSMKFIEEKNTILIAQAHALKEMNTELDHELDQLKIAYNNLDDECEDLWRERLLKTHFNIDHHRRQAPSQPPLPLMPSSLGFDLKGYADSIDIHPEHGFVSMKTKVLSEDEKKELFVKRVLNAKAGFEHKEKPYDNVGYFGLGEIAIAQALLE